MMFSKKQAVAFHHSLSFQKLLAKQLRWPEISDTVDVSVLHGESVRARLRDLCRHQLEGLTQSFFLIPLIVLPPYHMWICLFKLNLALLEFSVDAKMCQTCHIIFLIMQGVMFKNFKSYIIFFQDGTRNLTLEMRCNL